MPLKSRKQPRGMRSRLYEQAASDMPGHILPFPPLLDIPTQMVYTEPEQPEGGFLMSKGIIAAIAAVVLIATNLYAFLLMKKDKECAKKGDWRVPEAKLFLATGCFGGLGGVLGMKLLRHKTQHWYFKLFFPIMLILQIALLAFGACLLFR